LDGKESDEDNEGECGGISLLSPNAQGHSIVCSFDIGTDLKKITCLLKNQTECFPVERDH
jgi:hypothetical protein